MLAGGKSRRLGGSAKALLDFGGKPLIGRVVEQAVKVSSLLVVSLGKNDREEYFRSILPRGVEFVWDEVEDRGPLEGFRVGLERLGELGVSYSLTLACDLPFLKAEVLRFMLEEAERLRAEALIPRWPNGFTEALHSVYQPKPMAEACRQALQAGERLVMDAVRRLSRVCFLSVEKLRPLDPELETLTNINTPEDLEAALAKLRGAGREDS